jgi:hypothetical protein
MYPALLFGASATAVWSSPNAHERHPEVSLVRLTHASRSSSSSPSTSSSGSSRKPGVHECAAVGFTVRSTVLERNGTRAQSFVGGPCHDVLIPPPYSASGAVTGSITSGLYKMNKNRTYVKVTRSISKRDASVLIFVHSIGLRSSERLIEFDSRRERAVRGLLGQRCNEMISDRFFGGC